MSCPTRSSFAFTVLRDGKPSFIYEPDALDFEDADAAREHALAMVEEIVGQDFLNPHDWRAWDVEVRGADGLRLIVPFTEGCGPSPTAQVFRMRPGMPSGA
jgi:hypothetical protein